MEHFTQTNVFAQIRTVFARIRTVFAHLIIGCAIRYPIIGSLRYIYNIYIYIYISLGMLVPNSRDRQGKLWLPKKQKTALKTTLQ